MQRAFVILVGLVLLLPAAAPAQDRHLSVRVTALPSGTPLAGVRAGLWVLGRKLSPPPETSAAGRVDFDLTQLAPAGEQSVTVTLSLSKTNFRRVDLTRICKLQGPPDCTDIEIEMEPATGSSALSADERQALAGLVSTTGSALFLLPYEVLPPGSTQRLSLDVLATSLDRAITTQIQALQWADGTGAGLKPLPPISLVPLDKPQLTVSPTNFEKLRAIGTHVQALAVISGSIFAPDANRLEVSSNFLIIPTEGNRVRQRQRIDDRGLPTPLNPFDLEARLRPEWGYDTLIALGVREYAIARQTHQPGDLIRVYRYLAAAKADAIGREGVELHDINALMALIEKDLGL